MTFSTLATRFVETKKFGSRKGNSINQLVIHHTAGGTNEKNIAYLATASKQVSATYVLATTGELVGIVPEELRPWTTGWDADRQSITVETVNSSGAPEWRVTDIQLEVLAQLAADLCVRYNWGRLDRSRIRAHREYAKTACPGPYLWDRFDAICDRANEILFPPAPVVQVVESIPTPVEPTPEATTPGTPEDFFAFLERVVQGVIRGEYGNGGARVNALLALGLDQGMVDGIQIEVEKRLAALHAPELKSNEEIAHEVLQGKWGVGQDRRARLSAAGYNPNLVQAEVNRLLNR